MNYQATFRQAVWRVLIVTLSYGLLSILCLYEPRPASADIRFEEVTKKAGFVHAGTTWGASWGDFNGDGWPDLWVGNHDSKPTLYLNKQDGTFVDVIDQVWSADPRADMHGAAWADFDNDGDQDLVDLVDARINEDGTFCVGCGLNQLFVNDDGSLRERSKEFGLDDGGLARSPLWFDADRDGMLDLLVVNTRARRKTSEIFHQRLDGFKESNEKFRFQDTGWSRRYRVWDFLRNALRLNFKETPLIHSLRHLEFAQLADLAGGQDPELIVFSSPTRVYSISSVPFVNITATVGFPQLEMISDVAIEDFNGDGRLEMYLTRGERQRSGIIQGNSHEIKGNLQPPRGGEPKTLQFRSEGEIHLQIYPFWLRLSNILIGSGGRHPTTKSFSLFPEDPEVSGPEPSDLPKGGALIITYDRGSRVWTIRNSYRGFVDLIVRSAKPIKDLQTLGFKTFQPEMDVDYLLIRRGIKYFPEKLPGKAGAPTLCHSVVAGDLDNDMDIDLYLVCEGPVENLPNRLLENDGNGKFRLVPNAGGAMGSHLGRGDVGAIADYDRDGFLDLFVTNGSDPTSPFGAKGPHQLFHNRGNNNHWLEIDLEGVESNRDGIGSSITLEAGGVTQVREQRGGMHRLTQNHQRIHFGLGRISKVDRLTVRWPSELVQEITNIAPDRVIRVREEAGLTNKMTRRQTK